MKAIAVKQGIPNTVHLTELPAPQVGDIPNGRGVLVRVLRVRVAVFMSVSCRWEPVLNAGEIIFLRVGALFRGGTPIRGGSLVPGTWWDLEPRPQRRARRSAINLV